MMLAKLPKDAVRRLQTPPFEQALPGITVMRLMDLIPKVRLLRRDTSLMLRISSRRRM